MKVGNGIYVAVSCPSHLFHHEGPSVRRGGAASDLIVLHTFAHAPVCIGWGKVLHVFFYRNAALQASGYVLCVSERLVVVIKTRLVKLNLFNRRMRVCIVCVTLLLFRRWHSRLPTGMCGLQHSDAYFGAQVGYAHQMTSLET
jgi:hypothetical protein